MALSVRFDGSLTIQESTTSGTCGPGAEADGGSFYPVTIGSPRKSADAEIGMKLFSVSDSVSFIALPLPTGMLGRLLYLRNLTGDDIEVRLTDADSEETTLVVAGRGMLLLEPGDDTPIMAVGVRGEATITWVVTGDFI
jgi:hypothetical protein